MLSFRFHKEFAGREVVYRPRIAMRFLSSQTAIEAFALLDSGADRTVIPQVFAELLGLFRGAAVTTTGIGGTAEGYESQVDLELVDLSGQREVMEDVPIYVLNGFTDVVIGRNKLFDLFRVTLEQFNLHIGLEAAG